MENENLNEPVVTPQTDEDFKDVKKGNGLKVGIIVVLVVALVGVLGYFGYTKLFSASPKDIFETAIADTVERVSSALDSSKTYSALEGKMKIEVSGLLFQTLGLNVLNDYEILYDVKTDSNKNGIVGLTITDTKNKMDAKTYIYSKDGKYYLELKDVYNKIIELGNDEESNAIFKTLFDMGNNQQTVKVKYLLEKVSNAFIKSLDDNNFKKEKANVKVNGKDYSVNAITYELTEENLKKTGTDIAKAILDDETALNYIASMAGTDIDEVKKSLEDAINGKVIQDTVEIDDPDSDPSEEIETIKVTVYTRGVKSEVVGLTANAIYKDKTVEALHYYNVDENLEFEVTDSFKAYGSTAKGGKLEVQTYDEIKKAYETVATFTVNEKTDEKINVDFEVKVTASEEMPISGLSGNITSSLKTEGTKDVQTAVVTLNIEMQGVKSTIKLSMDATGDTANSPVDVNIPSSVKIENVDTDKLGEAIMNHYSKFSILKVFTSLGE